MADRPLHIGVDGRELLGRPTGVGRYLAEVLRRWSTDPTWLHRVSVFIPSAPPPALAAELGPRVCWRSSAGGSGTWWEQRTLPGEIRRAGVDVFFAAGYTAPVRISCPFVVAIYDVSFFAHPEWFGRREGLRRRWLTRSAARRAHGTITISDFSAAEIVRWLGIGRDRVILAPPGAPEALSAVSAARRGETVLYVGSLFGRRHIPELIEAFAIVAQSHTDAHLVLVGDNRTSPPINPHRLAAAAGIASRVEWREYVGDDSLQELYRTASVFVFLSDYEGFGMTPLEASAHDLPVVLLDTAITREVYGSAACVVRATAPSIASALSTLLNDEAARARLIADGRQVLARFSWTRTATTIRLALEAAAER
ncbi:MAG: glycosyltransferase family 1 protein [Vicinamibacterales bacterium]